MLVRRATSSSCTFLFFFSFQRVCFCHLNRVDGQERSREMSREIAKNDPLTWAPCHLPRWRRVVTVPKQSVGVCNAIPDEGHVDGIVMFGDAPFEIPCVIENGVLYAERPKSTSRFRLWRHGCVSYKSKHTSGDHGYISHDLSIYCGTAPFENSMCGLR